MGLLYSICYTLRYRFINIVNFMLLSQIYLFPPPCGVPCLLLYFFFFTSSLVRVRRCQHWVVRAKANQILLYLFFQSLLVKFVCRSTIKHMIFKCFDWPASLVVVVVVVEEKSFDDAGVVLSCNMAKIASLLTFDVWRMSSLLQTVKHLHLTERSGTFVHYCHQFFFQSRILSSFEAYWYTSIECAVVVVVVVVDWYSMFGRNMSADCAPLYSGDTPLFSGISFDYAVFCSFDCICFEQQQFSKQFLHPLLRVNWSVCRLQDIWTLQHFRCLDHLARRWIGDTSALLGFVAWNLRSLRSSFMENFKSEILSNTSCKSSA